VLPFVAQFIAGTADTIETHLQKQTKLSDLKYQVFGKNQAESHLKNKLELSIRKNISKLQVSS